MANAKGKSNHIKESTKTSSLDVLDLLATLVLLVSAKGEVLYANSATQEILGLPRKLIEGNLLSDFFVEYKTIISCINSAQKEHFSALRFDATIKRAGAENMPVHVILASADTEGQVFVEL